MKLFSLDKNYDVVWEPYVAVLEPFAKILKRDKTKGKIKANKELAFIYFYCDIKSDYAITTDPEAKMLAIREDLGLGEKWKLDDVMGVAIKFYRERSMSITAQILADSTYIANKVSSRMKEAVDETDLDIGELEKLLNSLKKIPDVIKSLKAAEREVIKEIEEAQGSIGSKEKSMFEDLELFKENG